MKTLFIPAISKRAAESFANAVWGGRMPNLPEYSTEADAREFGDAMGPGNIMKVFKVTDRDGVIFADECEAALAS